MTVLCAIDPPASAPAVARAAARIAGALAAPLVLAHVLPPPSRRARCARPGDAVALLREQDASLGWALLDEIAAVLGFPVAGACLRSGVPAEVLCRLAGDHAAELLVVGSRAHGSVRRAGVAATVLRRTGCPVLTVPATRGAAAATALAGGRSVVCGVAAARAGDIQVASRAADLAQALGASLELVHVVSPLERRSRVRAAGRPLAQDQSRAAVRRGQELLDGVRDAVLATSPMRLEDVGTHLRRGSPGPVLAAHAGRRSSLIVVGTRCPSPLQAAVAGSTVATVERDAAVCVLATRITGAREARPRPSRRG